MVMQGLNNNQDQRPVQHEHDRSNEMRAVLSHLETLREVILEQQRTIQALGKELRQIRRLSAQSENNSHQEVIDELATLLKQSNRLQQQPGQIPPSKRRDMNQKAKKLYARLVQSN